MLGSTAALFIKFSIFVKMLRAYKYRIYPTDEQKVLLAKTFGCCRFVYNWALNLKITAYSVMIWNETKVFCKLINGVKGYISSISYIQETNSISLFVEMVQYANILFAPMTQLYSSSLETVKSIPSDAINLDF